MAAEADDDARHADEVGLDPEAHGFVVEEGEVAVGLDVGGGFELDPVGWVGGVSWFGAPDWRGKGQKNEEVENKEGVTYGHQFHRLDRVSSGQDAWLRWSSIELCCSPLIRAGIRFPCASIRPRAGGGW